MTKNEMNYRERTRREERQVLAHMVRSPKEAFSAVEALGLTRALFDEPRHAAAFAALLEVGPDGGRRLKQTLFKTLGDELKSADSREEFLALAADAASLKKTFAEFAGRACVGDALRKIASHAVDPALRLDDLPDVAEGELSELRRRIADLMDYCGEGTPAANAFDGTVPTPDDLMNVPGFINDLAAHTYATAPRPNRVLAFAGALAMLSLMAARKYTDERGTRSNLYLVALADSGVGKDWPRKVNKSIADGAGKIGTIAEQLASGEGLEDALYGHHAMLFQIDEFDTFLNTLKERTNLSEHLYTYVLSLFSASDSYHTLRKKALSMETKETMALDPDATASKPTLVIHQPSLSILATAVPSRFYSSLTTRALENGLLARFIVFEAGLRGDAGTGLRNAPLPDSVVNAAKFMAQRANECAPWGREPKLTLVADASGVKEAAKAVRDEADALYNAAQKRQDDAAKAVWNRGYEMTCKLALLHALSANVCSPKITPEGFAWGWRLVRYSSKRMLAMAAAYVAVDRDDELCLKIMRYLKKQRSQSAKRCEITHVLHIRCDRMDILEETLVDQGRITITEGARGAKIYRVTDTRKKGL